MNLNSTHPLNRTKPMLKAALAISALLASNTALADIEVGAHTGLNMINMDDQENAALGVAIRLDPRRRGKVASSKGTLSK